MLMFRSTTLIQYAFILAISFISGVVCFQAFSLDKSMKLISYVDPRVLEQTNITIWHSIIPLVGWIVLVLLFASHPYFHVMARFVVAVKATFFGFCSVYLLTQHQSILFYSVWWFPFQLIYCILLFVLCSVFGTRKVGTNRKFFLNKKLLFILLILFSIICAGEIAAISYIFR